MAVPYKRNGSRHYWADIWFGGRKRSISLKTPNFGVARAILHERLAGLAQRGLELPTRTAIGPLVTKFVEHLCASGRAKSVQTDVYRLREFFGPVCEELMSNPLIRAARRDIQCSTVRARRATPTKPKRYEFAVRVNFAEEVTTAVVANFLNALRNGRKLDSKTINEYREVVHRFFEWAIRRQGVRMPGEMRLNPVADIPRLRACDPVIRFLRTLEDIRFQLDALGPWPQLRVMVAVLIYAGLRRGELLHLTPNDVDLKTRRILVRGKRVDGVTFETKTGRNRLVPISRALMGYLEQYRTRPVCPWFFPSPEGTLWDLDNFSHRLGAVNRSLGLHWNCLDYRHTFGSHLAMKGESLYKISELMGNSPEICRRHYACLLPESLVGCVEFDSPQDWMQRAAHGDPRLNAESASPALQEPRAS